MLLIKYIALAYTFFFATALFATCKEDVLICYGKLNPKEISGYKYVILESVYYTKDDVALIKQQNELVLCYISLGEVNAHASYFHHLKALVTKKNELWNSYYLNISSIETQDALTRIISEKLAKGFDGLFLDNIDNYSSYGRQHNQKKVLVNYLKKLKAIHPTAFFMQNSGLQLITETHKFINAIAFESVASAYNLKTKAYRLRNDQAFNDYIHTLKQLEKTYELPIILIEYANDLALYKRIQSRIKPTKWRYFIGKIDLQTIQTYSKK